VAIGALVFTFEPVFHAVGIGDGWDKDQHAFAARSETLFFLLLICAETALWALLLVPAWTLVRTLRRWASWRFVVIGAVLTAVVASFVGLIGRRGMTSVLDHQAFKFGVITALGYFLVALPAAVAVWAVQRAADEALALPASWLESFRAFVREDTGEEQPTGIEWYLRMRAHLERGVTILGLVVAAAVLATASFRNANLAWAKAQSGGKVGNVFAFERVLLFGLFFTLLIALLYAPAHLRLRAVGARLRDSMAPEPTAGADWAAAYDERAKLESVLGLNAGLMSSFGPAAAVFAPFVAAILSSLLER
jgi:lysylphosphatidylglycerol synthetase-like protein (DUF2156 family)